MYNILLINETQVGRVFKAKSNSISFLTYVILFFYYKKAFPVELFIFSANLNGVCNQMHFLWLECKRKDTGGYLQRHVYTVNTKTC